MMTWVLQLHPPDSSNLPTDLPPRESISQRAENGGLGPSWLDFAFFGAPRFLVQRFPNPLAKAFWPIFGTSGRKIGAPQKHQIQPRRTQPPHSRPSEFRVVFWVDFESRLKNNFTMIAFLPCFHREFLVLSLPSFVFFNENN